MNEWPNRYTQEDLQQIISRTGIDPMLEEIGIKQFVVRCPNCISDDVKCISGTLLRYSCNECGVVFTWKEADIEIMKPQSYEITCDTCDLEWSEFDHMIWCYDCQKDTSGEGGVFNDMIPLHLYLKNDTKCGYQN